MHHGVNYSINQSFKSHLNLWVSRKSGRIGQGLCSELSLSRMLKFAQPASQREKGRAGVEQWPPVVYLWECVRGTNAPGAGLGGSAAWPSTSPWCFPCGTHSDTNSISVLIEGHFEGQQALRRSSEAFQTPKIINSRFWVKTRRDNF